MADYEIEIFRAGQAASKGITADDVAAVASSYDPERNPAPVVMGHPEPGHDHSAPAFGAISGLRADGDKLFGTIKNLAQTAIDGVKNSRILNRSAAFWHPDHPSNPTPGKLSFRHLGLLGGSPPAIPGMEPLRFGADDQLEAPGNPGDPMIYAAPADPADAVSAALQDPKVIQGMATAVAAILEPQSKRKDFAVTEEELKAAQDKLEADRAAFAADQKKLEDDKAAFAADEKARADQAKKDREAANTQFAADLVEQGKFPAGRKDDLVTILNALPVETLQFSGDTETDPATALKSILGDAEKTITFAASTPSGDPPKGGDDDAEAKALAAADAGMSTAYQGKK